MHHGGVGDHTQVAPVAGYARLAQRHDVVFRRNFFLDTSVKILVLEKNNRVVIADRGLDQALGIVGAGRTDNFYARNVHEPHLRILRVIRSAVNIAAAGTADNDWGRRAPTIVRFGNHINDLVESASDEIHELKLRDRTHAGKRGSEGGANYCRFRDGSVDDAFRAEAMNESISDFEGPAVDTDVFAQAENSRVA